MSIPFLAFSDINLKPTSEISVNTIKANNINIDNKTTINGGFIGSDSGATLLSSVIELSRIGSIVCIKINPGSANIFGSVSYNTLIPEQYRPLSGSIVGFLKVENNGTAEYGVWDVDSAGNIFIYPSITESGFTTHTVINSSCITYLI